MPHRAAASVAVSLAAGRGPVAAAAVARGRWGRGVGTGRLLTGRLLGACRTPGRGHAGTTPALAHVRPHWAVPKSASSSTTADQPTVGFPVPPMGYPAASASLPKHHTPRSVTLRTGRSGAAASVPRAGSGWPAGGPGEGGVAVAREQLADFETARPGRDAHSRLCHTAAPATPARATSRTLM